MMNHHRSLMPDSLPTLSAASSTADLSASDAEPAWWLDVASPTWEDMRTIGKVSYMSPISAAFEQN
jgi:magnesium transporter